MSNTDHPPKPDEAASSGASGASDTDALTHRDDVDIPLTEEDAAASDAAWAAYVAGDDPGESLISVRTRLRREHRVGA